MEANEFKKTLQNLNIFCKNTFEIQQNIKTDEVVGVAYYSSWLFLNNDSINPPPHSFNMPELLSTCAKIIK